MTDTAIEVSAFRAEITARCAPAAPSHGASAATEMRYLPLWIQYFRSVRPAVHAAVILDGVQAAALEAIACIEIGLARAAVVAMRSQIELMLGFTYFSHHPIEWDSVTRTGNGFMLFSDLTRYHRDVNHATHSRLEALKHVSPMNVEKLYRLLSAHVHGQSSLTLPKGGSLTALIVSDETQRDLVRLQTRTDEALSDMLVALHATAWAELPPAAVSRVAALLEPDKRSAFFRG